MLPVATKSLIRTVALCGCLILALGACSSRAQRAQNYYNEGQALVEKHEYIKARIQFRNAIQQKPDMLEAWRALAKVDEEVKNWQELAGSLRRVTDLDKKDAKARVQLAKLYLLGGAVDQALQMTNQAVDLLPKDASVLALKAAVLFRLKDTNGATREAENALKLDPGNLNARIVLASEKFQIGDNAGALQTLSNIPSSHKNDLGLILLKARIYDKMGNVQEVESLLKQLVALYPKQEAFRLQLVRFYVAHNRPADAEKELRTFVAAHPTDVNAELELVSLLSSIKGPAAAQSELDARIKAGGKVFPYQIALAKLEFAQGNIAASTELLKKLSAGSDQSDATTAKATLAQLDMARNDVAAAEPLIAEILKTDSRNITALQLRAAIRLNRGQVDDAISDLRRALNDEPRSPSLLASLALAYERSGAIELANKSFLDATNASGFAANIGLNYVAFLERRGQASEADNILTQLAERNPTNIAVLSALAQSKLAHQDWAGAEKIADTIRRLNKKTTLPDQITGAALIGQKKLNDSLSTFEEAYNQDPAAQPMATLVSVYVQAGQLDKAEAFVQSALKANPHNAQAYVLLGGIKIAKNNLKEAQADFESAIKQDPKSQVGYEALAKLYVGLNKPDEAIQALRAGLQQQPKDFTLRLTLAAVLERKQDYNGAISEYESMLKDQPGSLVVANNLASLLSDHRTDKASLEKARTLAAYLKDSPIPQFKDTVGWIDYQQGDYRAAISLLETAAAKLPNVPMIHFHLGMTYLAAGEAAKASEQFKTALKLSPNDKDLKAKIDTALQNHPAKSKS